MTALRLGLHPRRCALPFAGAAIAGAAFFFVPRGATLPDRPALAAIATSRPAPRPVTPRETLPFTMPDVVGYFTRALMREPEDDGNTAVFTGPGNGHAEDVFRIAITPEKGELVVAFSGGGDYGVTLAREFFEAPFFERNETLCFFTLLEESRSGPATATLRRFTVRFTRLEHSDDFHLTLRFSPHISL